MDEFEKAMTEAGTRVRTGSDDYYNPWAGGARWAREWLSMNNPLIGEEKLAKFASENQRLREALRQLVDDQEDPGRNSVRVAKQALDKTEGET